MEVLLIAGVALVIVVGGLAHQAFFTARGRAKRALRGAPRISIAEAKDGDVVKLAGKLRFEGEPLSSPLEGRPCAYFFTMVEHKKSSGKSSYWASLIEETSFCPKFSIDDGTGTALVELVLPNVVLNMDRHFRTGFLADTTPRLERFLLRHGESSQGWVFNRTLRFKEGVLEQGETVAVYGLCRWELDPDPQAAVRGGYRDRPMRLKIVDPPDGEMLISDDASTL